MNKVKYIVALLAFLISLGAGIGFYRNKTTRPPCPKCSVVVISIDPLRADSLPCFGYTRNTAPHICRFGDRSIVFTNAFSASSWTLPSIMSFFTSQLPFAHQMFIPNQSVLSPQTTTLPQALKQAGYHTIYMGDLDHSHLPLKRGLGRGFDETLPYDRDGATIQKIIKGLNNPQKPTFLFLHNFDMTASWRQVTNPPKTFPFDPTFAPQPLFPIDAFLPDTKTHAIHYLEQIADKSALETHVLSELKASNNAQTAAASFRKLPKEQQNLISSFSIFEQIDTNNPTHMRLLQNLYDERLVKTDTWLSPVLDLLSDPKIKNNVIVVVVSNHGDEFGEHGKINHGTNVYNPPTHIPLILSIPHVKPGRIDSVVSGIDVYPTILSAVGIATPKRTQGQSLLGIMRNTNQKLRGYAVSQIDSDPQQQAIRTDEWTLYQEGRTKKLYSRINDPYEITDTLSHHPSVGDKLESILSSTNAQINN